jgi:hypothetical protein
MKFATVLPDDSPYAAWPAVAGKDAATLAREIFAEEFSARLQGLADDAGEAPRVETQRGGGARQCWED